MSGHSPRGEMEADEQPCPLHIVKRDSDASCSSSKNSRSSQRKSSSGTDESQGSVHEVAGMDLPLAIPKKRKAMVFRHGERFNSGASVAGQRRAINYTDNFEDRDGSSSDSGEEGRRLFHTAEADGFTSVRLRYLQDEQNSEHDHREGLASQLPRSVSERAPSPYFDLVDTMHSRRAEAEAKADKEAENASYLHQMDIMRHGPPQTERFDLSDDENRSRRGSETRDDMLRRCSSFEYVPRTGLSPASTFRTYGRLASTNTLPEVETVPLSPFERSETTPFRGQQHHQHHQQQYYQHQPHNPRALPQFRPGLPYVLSEPAPDLDPQMLTPIITITPERRSVGGTVNRFWAAVELHAQITRPLDGGFSREYPFNHSSRQSSISVSSSKDNADLYRYGYISDMNIEILPTAKSGILEVIGKSPSLITLLPGSRRLLVAHIQLDTKKGTPQLPANDYWAHRQRQKSDRLIEDLEVQLGATSQEYMHIRLTYTHSGFPKREIGRDVLGREGGCVSVRTTIETTAIAMIMQQNTSSPWSPPPPPSSSPLSGIVARHWGPAAAADMAQRMAATSAVRMARKSAIPMRPWDSLDPHVAVERQRTPEMADSGEQEELTPRAALQQRESGPKDDESSPRRAPTPVGKIWRQIRRVSSTGMRSTSRQHAQMSQDELRSSSLAKLRAGEDSPPPGCFPPRAKNAKEPAEGLRQAIPDTAPRAIRRAVGIDTTNLQSLSHRVSDLSLGSENIRERQPTYSGMRSNSGSSSMSKKSGKWSWTGWFA